MNELQHLVKKPLAWIPVAMSLAALLVVLGYLAVYGLSDAQSQQDEGTAAHLFQMLLVGQVPVVAIFLIRWLPEKPKEALKILALQALAGFIPLTTIFLLEL